MLSIPVSEFRRLFDNWCFQRRLRGPREVSRLRLLRLVYFQQLLRRFGSVLFRDHRIWHLFFFFLHNFFLSRVFSPCTFLSVIKPELALVPISPDTFLNIVEPVAFLGFDFFFCPLLPFLFISKFVILISLYVVISFIISIRYSREPSLWFINFGIKVCCSYQGFLVSHVLLCL